MAKYDKQIRDTQAAHMASRALADAAKVKIADLWSRVTSGKITVDQFAVDAKQLVRFSYKESWAVARLLVIDQADMGGWDPSKAVGDTDYLKDLLLDVDRNVAEFKASDHSEKAARRLTFRIELSAITAAERGFTDSQLAYYGDLRDMGFRVTKLWLANFVNNEPCVDCITLSGTSVPFDQEFPIPTLMRTAVYRDLQGPPLHVRCKCVMVVLITRADNILDRFPSKKMTIPTTMSTDTVKSLPARIFDSILKVLRLITGGSK